MFLYQNCNSISLTYNDSCNICWFCQWVFGEFIYLVWQIFHTFYQLSEDKKVKEESGNVEISDSMIEEIKQSTLAMFEATVMGANKESKDFSSSNEYLMVCL